MWHAHCSGHRNETKIFKLSIARRVRWYIVSVDLKLPLLIAGLCKCFPIACVILQIIFKFLFFFNIHAWANNVGFCWDGHNCVCHSLHRSLNWTVKLRESRMNKKGMLCSSPCTFFLASLLGDIHFYLYPFMHALHVLQFRNIICQWYC